ncbi:SLOG family protein [Nonomuraea roseoviolacea]|uniref:YspA cpYpsA-related SLOG domain-containing protein n=1 Tax=Nonomuraea roseoviolacea subsp. carminata TaxID=160689 RepID=A0ABT1K9H1_9ACTN|nr:SLOG family protein [Nonomuraea roseoviolacea]MCP2350653.1 hypothetical protein [Nonomuraea roseoviolacea subsp. carminata]
MTYRILITGSRTWTDWETVWRALDDTIGAQVKNGETEFVVVHGHCPRGADAIADSYCEDQAGWRDNAGQVLAVEQHPADWTAPCGQHCRTAHRRRRGDGTSYCPTAGLTRNQQMVDLGADICLAFIRDDSRGATDCARRAARAGIEVRRWTA